MNNKFYVWEVRVNVEYEGNSHSVLIKDDENSLEKIKAEIVELYGMVCYYEDIRREQVSKVDSLQLLEDYQYFKIGISSKIEVEKIEVR